jgi:hypothetical protein
MQKLTTEITRRHILQGGIAGSLLPVAQSAKAEIGLATALNRVARFRSLSQRGVKAYAQLALNVIPDRSKATLDTAQRLIQTNFTELATRSFSAEITQSLTATRAEGNKLLALLAAQPRREALIATSDQADRFTEQADKTTKLVATSTGSNTARILDISGNQRLFTQRLAKNYFLLAANSAPARASAIRQQMSADRAAFKESLAMLQSSPISTPGIRNEIELCNGQWIVFEITIDKAADRPQAMEDVATASERLLEIANSLTEQYERAIKQVIG